MPVELRQARQPSTAALPMREVRAAILACSRCRALVRCRSRAVPGAGATPADIAFVGLAPGRLGGDRTGIPFSGDRSGNLLREMISRAYLGRVFVTNLVRCCPRDRRGRNRDPGAREIANCREHLVAELTAARPRMIVCLGAVAWRELAGRGAEFHPRAPFPLKRGGSVLYPMYHPAYVVRGAYSVDAYMQDFIRLAHWLPIVADAPSPRARPPAEPVKKCLPIWGI